jgi:glycosyltransferase involved in cell wall biosynthesis
MEVNKNDISVAIATYNGGKFLNEQLISLVNQTHKPKEIIIIDDFSTDSTVQIIEKFIIAFPFIQLFINNENKGPVKTFEIAISKCVGNYIALCDQDDVWELDKLEVSLKELKSIEDVDKPSMVFTDLKMMDSKGNLTGQTFWETQGLNPGKMDFYRTLFLNSVTGCAVVFNKKMKDELVEIPVGIEMHDYWMALIALGIGKLKPLYVPTVKYRSHENSVTIKDVISYSHRIKKFKNLLFGTDEAYMRSNFEQAKLFLDLYGERLDGQTKKQLDYFVSLQKKSSLYRLLYIGFYKYFFIFT